jgi:hypothetical protein
MKEAAIDGVTVSYNRNTKSLSLKRMIEMLIVKSVF